ncbi:Uncharacterized protein dnm_071660 [Desulfonema magnum]|uniref:Uncharacterized protein n=1 Tax=Desulfonema magnum TaxID=45655 RepID=A0A975BSZ1_9BACT|nr:Uncharacterized protein dnm_071660 [Desulfonema magnum]
MQTHTSGVPNCKFGTPDVKNVLHNDHGQFELKKTNYHWEGTSCGSH